MAADFGDAGGAGQRHGDVEFVAQNLDRSLHAGLAAGAEAVDIGASAQTRPGAERSARMMSCPLRIPPSKRISIDAPTASAIAGSIEMDDGAPSSCRPPWLETTSAAAPLCAASRASSRSRIPLRISLPGQISGEPFDVFPAQRTAKLARNPVRQGIKTRGS